MKEKGYFRNDSSSKVKIVVFRFVKWSSKDRKINKKLLFYIKNYFQKNSTNFNQNLIWYIYIYIWIMMFFNSIF